jgi:DNA polymerase-3 subunit epsilon
LTLARSQHPGQKNSLDALCKRYGVDNSQRTLHGALLDAEILADVYLAMTGGQVDLGLELTSNMTPRIQRQQTQAKMRGALPLIQPSTEELAAHGQRLAAIDKASGGKCVWQLLYAERPAS